MQSKGRTFRQLLQDEPYLFTGGIYSPLDAQIAESAANAIHARLLTVSGLQSADGGRAQLHELPVCGPLERLRRVRRGLRLPAVGPERWVVRTVDGRELVSGAVIDGARLAGGAASLVRVSI